MASSSQGEDVGFGEQEPENRDRTVSSVTRSLLKGCGEELLGSLRPGSPLATERMLTSPSMKEARWLMNQRGLTHLASDLKLSLATLQHVNLKSKSMKHQPNSEIFFSLSINLKSGDIPRGPTVILKLNYTLSP